MTNIQTAVVAFTAFNAVRVVSYMPQIIKIWKDRHGSEAVSILTWTLFSLSHFSTVAYAIVVVNDAYMAVVFSANATCCVLIVILTRMSRISFARAPQIVDGKKPLLVQDDKMRQALLDLSKMALTTTDDNSEYCRAYADIANHVRKTVLAALSDG